MSSAKAKLAVASGLVAVALSACATAAKPVAGTPGIAKNPGTRGKVDDPRTTKNDHLACLRQANLQVAEIGGADVQIGSPPGGPSVHFTPTAGVAQGLQMDGQPQYQGAEVIGSALLYPNQGSDAELKKIESCLAVGVTG
jgi:hypothetical protein